jgi:hypothetical protein
MPKNQQPITESEMNLDETELDLVDESAPSKQEKEVQSKFDS